MSVIDKYSEISGAELVNKLKKYVETVGIDFSIFQEISAIDTRKSLFSLL